MLQFIISSLPLLAVIAAVFAAAFKVKCSGACVERVFYDLGLEIVNSPAQVAFFMFSFAAAIASALLTGVFAQISNQFILSLDIVFFFNSLLLILLHQFKECASAPL